MSSRAVQHRSAVPEVEATVSSDLHCLADSLRQHEAVYVADGDTTIAIAFSPAAFGELVERVDLLELQLSAWEADLELREGRLIAHEEVVASTERLVVGED